MCYTTDITQDTSRIQKQVKDMLIEVDFNSDEALYIQLQNQIILGIAMDLIKEGDALPSVRQMADLVGINMHTVNKALDIDKAQALLKMRENLRILLARGCCKNVSREEVHALVDDIFDEYGKE